MHVITVILPKPNANGPLSTVHVICIFRPLFPADIFNLELLPDLFSSICF